MNKLLIIGAGSFSTEVDEIARLSGYTQVAFLDDNAATARSIPVIGRLNDLHKMKSDYSEAIVAFGDIDLRMKYHSLLKDWGFQIPILIHPNSYISPDAVIKCGTIIRTNVVVSRYVEIGEACILNVGSMIDHDCVLEEGCHILMGAVIRNKKRVPKGTWVKSNTVFE